MQLGYKAMRVYQILLKKATRLNKSTPCNEYATKSFANATRLYIAFCIFAIALRFNQILLKKLQFSLAFLLNFAEKATRL